MTFTAFFVRSGGLHGIIGCEAEHISRALLWWDQLISTWSNACCFMTVWCAHTVRTRITTTDNHNVLIFSVKLFCLRSKSLLWRLFWPRFHGGRRLSAPRPGISKSRGTVEPPVSNTTSNSWRSCWALTCLPMCWFTLNSAPASAIGLILRSITSTF